MRNGLRVTALALTVVMTMLVSLTAFAGEPVVEVARDGALQTDDRAPNTTDREAERPADVVTDRPVEVETDRTPDSATDLRPASDHRPDRLIDGEVDRPIDRCHPRIVDHPRRCVHDERPHDFNVRHLIWRLIKAHEWEKLVRLLHWLGWL